MKSPRTSRLPSLGLPAPGGFLAAAPVLAALALCLVLSAASPAGALLGFFEGKREVKAENGLIGIPLADISPDQARFFRYVHEGKDIPFFLIKPADGQLRAAFDACDVCYPEKRGYRQDGRHMICVNCGRRFDITLVGAVGGGCNPAPLAVAVNGDTVRVAVADLLAGLRYFK